MAHSRPMTRMGGSDGRVATDERSGVQKRYVTPKRPAARTQAGDREGISTHPVRVELERVDLDAEGGDVLLLELAGQVALDEGGLTDTTVTHQNELRGRRAHRLKLLLPSSGVRTGAAGLEKVTGTPSH